MKKYFLFGYGSIINPHSAEKTLGRPLEKNELKMICLKNYERVWNLVDQVIIENNSKPTNAVFLNIQEKNNSKINGVIVPIELTEIERFDSRERNYNRVDVTDQIIPEISNGVVYTYIGKSNSLAKNFGDTAILSKYQKIVDEGVQNWGDVFKTEYVNSTQKHTFETIDGDYHFVNQS